MRNNQIYTQDETLLAALQFINDPPADNTERAKRGEALIGAMKVRLQALDSDKGITLFSYGGIIHRLKVKETWRLFPDMEHDWCQFSHFCDRHLGMSLSKANILDRVWRESSEVGLDPSEIQEIGWDAAQTILRIATNREETEHWIEAYHQSANRDEFKEKVRQAVARKKQGQDDASTGSAFEVPRRSFFLLRDSENKFVTESLEMAAQKIGKELDVSMTRSDALMLILTAWRAQAKSTGES